MNFYIQWFRTGCLTSTPLLCNIWVLGEASLHDNDADNSTTESKKAAHILEYLLGTGLCKVHDTHVIISLLKPPVRQCYHYSFYRRGNGNIQRLRNVSNIMHVSKASSLDPRALAFITILFLHCWRAQSIQPQKESDLRPGHSVGLAQAGDGQRPPDTL